jgi:hypothetical protein
MPEYAGANVVGATTALIKTGRGFLHSVVVNKAVISSTIKIYDGIDAGGTLKATITYGGALTSDPPWDAIYDIGFDVGLTIVTSAASDVTVSYR